MKRYLTLIIWVFCITVLSIITTAKGYCEALFQSNLTPASSDTFSPEVDAEIKIDDAGRVELSIRGLRSLPDNQPVNQNSTLVIETEINDSPQIFSESFDISNGDAELNFNLEGLNRDDKLEIISIVVNRGTTPDVTPTVTASPTGSPSATPTVVATASPEPTPGVTPTEEPTATPTITPTQEDVILVPGGIVSGTATATPTPNATPTPGGDITANININPNTINVRRRGRFKAVIRLSPPHNVNDIIIDTVEADGASAIRGTVARNRFVATFRTRDLDLSQDTNGTTKQITVSGELEDGTTFEGTDTVRIVGTDDEDDNNNNY
jgi:hypothetical protein